MPWDRRISREQADLYFDGDQLHVTCLDHARNPILCGRRAFREVSLNVGQEFRIGETRFSLRESEASTRDSINQQFEEATPAELVEDAYSAQDLLRVGMSHTVRQAEILAAIPQRMVDAATDDQFARQLLPGLLDGIPAADGAVIARFDDSWLKPSAGPDVLTRPEMIQVLTRAGFRGQFRPSRRLILQALREGRSCLHRWGSGERGGRFTVSEGLGWACCVPLRGEACRGWCLYVAGRLSSVVATDDGIRGDLRFAEMLAQFLAATRQVRLAAGRSAQWRTRVSLSAASSPNLPSDPERSEALQADMANLYCEVAGGMQPTGSTLGMQPVLDVQHDTLNMIAGGILDREGTIVEAGADVAMAVWGWPLRQPDGPLPACRAALDISRSFVARQADAAAPGSGGSVNIGIAFGPTTARFIGPPSLMKVATQGIAVDRAVVLATCARTFGTGICLDDVAAGWAQLRLKSSLGRIRRLARVHSDTGATPFEVFALLPPPAETPALTDSMLGEYDAALTAVIDGEWDEARERLARLPVTDLPTKFLQARMAEANQQPPADWDGSFRVP